MPFPIPKLQYKNYSKTGNTSSGSSVISSMSDTTNLEVGMFVTGTGIPAGANILTVDSSTQITLDVNATANGTGVSLAFGVEISFDYPPVETSGEKRDAREHISTSISGIRQVSVDHLEVKRSLKFSFLSETLKLEIDDFIDTWGLLGKEFRYFDDKTLLTYVGYELSTLKYDPKKITGKGANAYVWEIAMDFRRVL